MSSETNIETSEINEEMPNLQELRSKYKPMIQEWDRYVDKDVLSLALEYLEKDPVKRLLHEARELTKFSEKINEIVKKIETLAGELNEEKRKNQAYERLIAAAVKQKK